MLRLTALFLVITLTFALMKCLPGDPFNHEQALPTEIHEALRTHYGLNDPWYVQYGRYLKNILTWDLGPSFRFKDRTVNEIICTNFPVSALLGIESLLLALGIGVSVGVVSARFANSWTDKTILLGMTLAVSLPSFILGSLLQYCLGLKLGFFPIARWESFAHSILPALSLAAFPAAFITKMVRSGLIETMQQPYIRTARAKGVSEIKIAAIHALKNALLPVVSYLGPLFANILVGSFIVEKIFAIPGLGQWFVNSVLNRDYTVIMGITVFYSFILLGAIALVDLIYVQLDPRLERK
jgi:oligopeptide transport system permease protein